MARLRVKHLKKQHIDDWIDEMKFIICRRLLVAAVVVALQHSSFPLFAAALLSSYGGMSKHSKTKISMNELLDHPPASATSLYMAMQVNIRIVGRKSSEPWLEEGVQMYETRLAPSNLDVETIWHKDDAALLKGVDMDRQKNHCVVCLDPNGKQMSSQAFSEKLYEWLEEGGSRLSFVIGGAGGLPSELKYPTETSGFKHNAAASIISLSSLTFTHQFARLLLVEQVYRASEIRKGSGYHK